MWLQSVEDGSVAFVVVNPQVIKPDYEPEISDADAQSLKLAAADDVLMLAIVTIRMDPFLVTANLRAPVVINKSLKIARQIVLEDADYSIRYNLSENIEPPAKATVRL
jgi:flagellar assembly factor FliW